MGADSKYPLAWLNRGDCFHSVLESALTRKRERLSSQPNTFHHHSCPQSAGIELVAVAITTEKGREYTMDSSTGRKASLGSKRRSPPPQGRSRPQSPLPTIPSATSVNGSVASSSAFTTRTPALSRSAYAATPSTDYGPNSANLGQNGNGNGIMGEESGSIVMDVSSDAQPQYAYSTTLRRQPSMEQGIFPRSSSPHRASPYRQRATSNPYGNGINVEEDRVRREPSILEKATSYGRKVLGREEYSSVRQDDDGQSERARRQKETPSSIYAHKTVDVSLVNWLHLTNPDVRIRYGTSKHTLPRVSPPQLCHLWSPGMG